MLSLRALSTALAVLAALASPPRADTVPCSAGIAPGTICLTGSVHDMNDGPLMAGQVYYIGGGITVPNGMTLTVEGGAIIKAASSGDFIVNGTLNVTGGAIFTSLQDDAAGGDTNLDGPTLPAPGDWNGIFFGAQSDPSSVSGPFVQFAKVGIALQQADITIDGATIRNCSTSAIDLRSNSFPIVLNCIFTFNEFAVERAPIGALPGFGNNSAGFNTSGDYIRVSDDTFIGNIMVGPGNSLNGRPFNICTTISVPAGQTLTFLPGTDIKFGPAPFALLGCGFMQFLVAGTLAMDGVTVTSLFDDTVDGDTNKDGNLTMPAPEDWGTVRFGAASDASTLVNSTFRYGGATIFTPPGPTILMQFADVFLDGVTVEFSGDQALRLDNNSFPTVQNSTFRNNLGIAVDRVHPDAVAGFTNNTAAMNDGGDYMRLLFAPGGVTLSNVVSMDAGNSLNSDGLFVVNGSITIQEGASLTLGEGVVFKWTFNQNMLIEGTLTCNGTVLAPVVFTSLPDDEILGDSNKDGAMTTPAPGDWRHFEFNPESDASSLTSTVVRYAGLGTANALQLDRADITMTDCVIERTDGTALTLSNLSFPTVDGCTFDDNTVAVSGVPIVAVPGFTNNFATGNTASNSLIITQGDASFGPSGLLGGAAIGPANALLPSGVFVVSTNVTVPAASRLTLLPGAIFKIDGNFQVLVDGTLVAGGIGDTVALTSIHDDSIGGDTNENGSATSGSPGEWQGLRFTSANSNLNDVLVRFAGSVQAGIDLISASIQMTDVVVTECGGAALDLSNSSQPAVTDCEFNACNLAVDGVPLRALPGFSGCTAELNTTGDYQRVVNASLTSDLSLNTSQTLNGGPVVLNTSVTVGAGATLMIDAGMVMKFQGDRTVFVFGTLDCLGSQFVPVVFTSLVDDFAGDTNKDMGATSPSRGDWSGFDFQQDSDDSRLFGARVRYASSAIRLFVADIQILDTSVEFAAGSSLDLGTNSLPEVRRSSFTDGTGIPVDRISLDSIPGFIDNTASGNTPGDYMHVTSANNFGTTVVARHNALNDNGVFVLNTSATVGGALTLRQGTIFKWRASGLFGMNVTSGGSLVVEGTGLEQVVLTSVHDDSVGGDTEKNGAATVPLAGDWGQLGFSNTVTPSLVENLCVRFCGSTLISFAGVRVATGSALVTLRSVRVDSSATDGFDVLTLSADATNLVAFDCAGKGMELRNGTFDVIHATVTNCVGIGIDRAASHSGNLVNSISFANIGGNVNGFAVGEVFSSDVDPGFAGVDGNIFADPQFVNRLIGDLQLGAGSPCIDAAAPAPIPLAKDHREASRILDDDLDFVGGPDMGAFERAAYELTFGGRPRLGTLLSFNTQGPAGTAIYVLGFLTGEQFLPPFGFTLPAPLAQLIILGQVPVGAPFFVPIPGNPIFIDFPFGIQALGLSGASGAGNTTNQYRGRIIP